LSVLKSKATSLQKSERKTLVSFLLLYSFFAVVILSFSAFIYYNLQKDVMLREQHSQLKEYADEFIGNFLRKHKESEAELSISLVKVKNPSEFGIVKLDGK